MQLKFIFTEEAPVPGGHYTQAIKCGEYIFISGQLPILPHTGVKVFGTIEEQTQQVLENLISVAKAAGSDLSHIVKVNIYLDDISYWPRVNEIYTSFFGNHKPARTIVPAKSLHYGFLIEADAIAVVNKTIKEGEEVKKMDVNVT